MPALPTLDQNVSVGSIFPGTGSTFPLDNILCIANYLESRTQLFFLHIESGGGIDTRLPIEHLNNIKEVFKPSIIDLANIFNVSRQAVYKWLSVTSQPETSKLDLIINFSKIADKFKNSGISRIPSLLKLKIYEDKSLLDYLKNEWGTKEIVQHLIVEAKIMEQAENKVFLSLSKTKPTDDWKSYISISGSLPHDDNGK